MTKFTKQNLVLESRGEYLMYHAADGGRKFVARFKYVRAGGSFAAFLRQRMTVEEYFTRMEAGEAPLQIVERLGYILPHIRRAAAAGDPSAKGYIERVWTRGNSAVAS